MTATRVVALYLPVALVLGGLVAVSVLTGESLVRFTRDPAAHFGFHPSTGVLSNLGALLWTVGAACAAFTARLLWLRGAEPDRRRFLFHGALLTTVLLLDDFFLGHDWFFVEVVPIGEKPVYVAYLAMTLALLVVHRNAIRRSPHALLIAALGFFGASVGADLVPSGTLPLHHLWEDGAKFAGIASWSAYFTTYSLDAIRS